MQKYEYFKKVTKTIECSFYQAKNKNNNREVLIKRIHQVGTWQSLFNNKNFILSNKQAMCPKMIQVFKKKKHFFIVYDKPAGPPLSQPELIGKIDTNRFFPMFSELCENINILLQIKKDLYILPQWIFINHNVCKIAHFEPFYDKQDNKSTHVYMYNLQRAIEHEQQKLVTNQPNPKFYKQRNLVFTLGVIAYQLLTGKCVFKGQTEEQYENQLHQLLEQAERRVYKATNNQKFAQFVSKMLGRYPFDIPQFEHIKNFSKRLADNIKPKKIDTAHIEFQMQKIKLSKNSRIKKMKNNKFIRPCCKTFQSEQQQNDTSLKQPPKPIFLRQFAKLKLRKPKNLFPQINTNRNRHSFGHCQSFSTNISRPTMFTSSPDMKNKHKQL